MKPQRVSGQFSVMITLLLATVLVLPKAGLMKLSLQQLGITLTKCCPLQVRAVGYSPR